MILCSFFPLFFTLTVIAFIYFVKHLFGVFGLTYIVHAVCKNCKKLLDNRYNTLFKYIYVIYLYVYIRLILDILRH